MNFAFESFKAFLDMGGYAFNVWASFGIALLAMSALTLIIVLQAKDTQRAVKRQAQLLTQKSPT